jgi:hypothetical protein
MWYLSLFDFCFLFSLINFIIYIARAVGSSCKNAEECGFNMICKGQRCACNDGQHEEEIKDVFGRLIKRCVMNNNNNNNNNGK